MITEVPRRHTIHLAEDGNPSGSIFQLVQPLLVGIATRGCQVVADLHCVYNRLKANRVQVPRLDKPSVALFQGYHVNSEIITLCVRWYVTYELS